MGLICFFKLFFLENYNQSVKQFESRSSPIFYRAWYPKLFANVNRQRVLNRHALPLPSSVLCVWGYEAAKVLLRLRAFTLAISFEPWLVGDVIVTKFTYSGLRFWLILLNVLT